MNQKMLSEVQKDVVFKRQTCRGCAHTSSHNILSLGEQYIVDFISTVADVKKPRAPLNLIICDHCMLVQLAHSVTPDLMYREFWYRSGINEQMRAALYDVMAKASVKAKLSPGDAIMDIGCNDGTMLSQYVVKPVFRVGVDPCNILQEPQSQANMDAAINDYFCKESAFQAYTMAGKKFKIITAIAMFYDLEEPAEFLQTCKDVLDDDGVLVIQMNYLKSMMEQNAFDNISHEHLTYFSLSTLKSMVNICGLQIVDVEKSDVNGGSFRVYLSKFMCRPAGMSDEDITAGVKNVMDMLKEEDRFNMRSLVTYIDFGLRIQTITRVLSEFIIKTTAKGKMIYVYGASTRGSTLLQTLWPAAVNCLPGAAERDVNKVGKFTSGTWISILSEEAARPRANYFLVLPWHFAESILKRETDWARLGGKFILPLPKPVVVEYNGIDTGKTEWKMTPVEDLI